MYKIILSAFAVLTVMVALVAFNSEPSYSNVSSVPGVNLSTVHFYGPPNTIILQCQQSGNIQINVGQGHTVRQLPAGTYCFSAGGSKSIYIDGTSTYSLTAPFTTHDCQCID